jgi:hypothetical protein
VIYLGNTPEEKSTSSGESAGAKEDELSDIRGEKFHARTYHDVAKLRAEAAEHSAKAAKYYSKYME